MERSYSRYLLVVLCVAIVATAVVLVALNAYTNSRHQDAYATAPLDDAEGNAYRDGFEAAKQRFEQYGLGINDDTQTLVGSVQNVSGGKIRVLQENLMADALMSGVSDEREVTISASTKISRETKKPEAQFSAEQEAFMKLAPSPTTQPPAPSVVTSIRLSDIKPGDRLRITAQEKDVTLLPLITATEIVVIGN